MVTGRTEVVAQGLYSVYSAHTLLKAIVGYKD